MHGPGQAATRPQVGESAKASRPHKAVGGGRPDRSADVRSDTGVDGTDTGYRAGVAGRAATVAAEFARVR